MILIIKKHTAVAAAVLAAFLTVAVFAVKPVYSEGVPLPVVMYHHISPKYELQNEYTISPEEFENDMKYISECGYSAISVEQLVNFAENGAPLPEKSILITFDDGFESFYKYAYPIIVKYNFHAVMAIVGDFTDKFTEANDHNTDYSYMTWDEIKELSRSGYVDIANHTYDMHSLKSARKGCKIKYGESTGANKEVMDKSLMEFQNKIEDNIGSTTRVFAYPFGFLCKEAGQLLNEYGFKIAFTCSEKVNDISGDKAVFMKLGRFNRPSGVPTYKFFSKLLETEK